MPADDRRNTVRFRSLHIILLPLAFAFAAAGALAASTDLEVASDADKAEVIYLEAVDAYEDGRYDDYYMLLRRARHLDPSDPYINGEIAELKTISPLTDSAGREEAYRAIRDRYYADVTNYHYATVLAEMAKNMRRYDDLAQVWQTLDSVYPDRTDPAMNLASVYLVQYIMGDTAAYSRCMAIYDRLQRGVGADIGLSSHKIRAYGVRRDTAAVVRELEFLRRSAPSDIDAQIFIGATYAQFAMPDSALAYFNRACDIDSTYGPAYLSRVELFNMTGDSIAYDREVFRAMESPNLDFGAKFKLLTDYVVKLYSDTAQRARIAHMFETLQELNPGEAELHAFYGAYNNEIDRPAEAAEQYAYAIALDPSKPEVWQALVMAYGRSGDAVRMLASAREAARRYPDDVYFPLVASNALLAENRPAEALALLDSVNVSALQGKEKESFYHGQRGDILYRLEMPDSAFAEYDRAINCNPENLGALNNAAYHMAVRGVNLARAKLYASMAVQSEPDNSTYLDTYAWVLFRLGEYDQAKTYIDRTLVAMGLKTPPADSLSEPSGEPLAPGGISPETDEINDLEAADVREPNSEIYDHAGDIYYHAGDRAEALEMWKAALELDPENKLIQKKVRQKRYFAE